jgi:hypothetical protein
MRGGAREGSGRKSKADEDKIRVMAENAIIKKYGSVELGFEALLASGSDMLARFAFEHAVGKPKDKIEHSTDPENPPTFIIQPMQTIAAPIGEDETNDVQ